MPIAVIPQVGEQFAIEFANANRFYGFNYPAGLVGDTGRPKILNVSMSRNGFISWDTDEFTDGEVFWGTQPGVYDHPVREDLYYKTHLLQLTGLVPEVTYYIKVKVVDRSGNVAESAEIVYTVPPDTPPMQPIYTPMVRKR